ncbi:MAG: AAA family ATPase [Bacteroidetes bacterium]|nr:MAG: AAA family ATPase [Bacteroidota bacterium]
MFDIDGRRLPTGLQSFKKIREEGSIYVDKTDLMWRMAQGEHVYFLSRPRRFGKSLLLNTFKAYFLGQKELFEGLAAERLEAQRGEKAWTKHPVFMFEFTGASYGEEAVKEVILGTIAEYEEEYGGSGGNSIKLRFSNLLKNATRQTGQRAVVLIDEYDSPLLESLRPERREWHERYKEDLRTFYKVFKVMDEYVRFVFVTGITRFSELSLFSGLNNLVDLTFDEGYATVCGLTQEEVEETYAPEIDRLVERLGRSREEVLESLKMAYDGYRFTRRDVHVYNPVSLFKCFSQGRLGFYWYNTGTPWVLTQLLPDFKGGVEELERPKRMNFAQLESLKFQERIDPTGLMMQAGYYTILSHEDEFDSCEIGLPNGEVKFALINELQPHLQEGSYDVYSFTVVQNFVRAIRSGDVPKFMDYLERFISYTPYSNRPAGSGVHEDIFRNIVHILFKLMGMYVQVEVRSLAGRSDMEVMSEKGIYVFEFKTSTVQDALQSALGQIREKGYASKHLPEGKTVHAIGVVFGEKGIVDWGEEVVE